MNSIISTAFLLTAVHANKTCLQGWMKEKDSCYKVIHDKQSWQGASDYCDDLESRLVTLNDQDEHDFVSHQLRSVNSEDGLWIGYYRNNTDWAWIDINATAVNHLDISSINNDTNCAAITMTGLWAPIQCATPLSYVCETHVTGCPTQSGWIDHDFRCMFVLWAQFEWDTARYECNNKGAELAVLNDLKADSFLQSQTALHGWVWVGLKFDSNLHNYTWIDGRRGYVDEVTTINPYKNGGCGAVGVDQTTRQVISMTTACDTRLSAVCEKARVTVTTTTPVTRSSIRPTTLKQEVSTLVGTNTQVLRAHVHDPLTTNGSSTASPPHDGGQGTSMVVDETGTSMTDDQKGVYRSIIQCLLRLADLKHEGCLDDVLRRTSCSSDMAGVFAIVCEQRTLQADVKVALLRYTMSAVNSLLSHQDSSMFCSQATVDVLYRIEKIVGSFVASTPIGGSLSLINKDISISVVDVNQSSSAGHYYEGEIAGCVIRRVSIISSPYTVGDLRLSVILTKSHNEAVEFDNWNELDDYYIISAVLTISAYRQGTVQGVDLTFTLLHTFDSDTDKRLIFERNTTEIVCAFYIPSTRVWSARGCGVVNTDSYTTTCECNHTTSFAVLMKVNTYQISEAHRTALSVITIIGCSISMITMFLSLTVFTCIRSLGSERVFVHRNLCLSIMLAQIVFLAGIKATYHKMVCRVIAIVLHYSYMSVFTWMLVEGLHLYTKVVQVFGTEKSRSAYYLVFGWGMPFVLVSISTVADFDGYGTESSCWLSIYRSTIWAFVGPAVAIMVINLTILTMVMQIVISSVKLDRPRHKDQILAGVKGTLFLLPLLGLTWIFGLLAINKDLLVFEYAFAVCNSLQGFFVFLFHCVFNTEVRQALKRLRDRQTFVIRGETVVYSGSVPDDSLSMESRHLPQKSRFLITGRIRVSPINDDQAIDNTDTEGIRPDSPGCR